MEAVGLNMTKYIIVTDTLCGPSYEWTTDENGKETIYTYDSIEEAEKELTDDLKEINKDREPEDYHDREEYSIEEYTGTETEDGRGQ